MAPDLAPVEGRAFEGRSMEGVDYIYDGSFAGFLCCVYEHYYAARAAGIFAAGRYQDDLLRRAEAVATDDGRADRVYSAIGTKISAADLKRVYLGFCSDVTGKEMKLLRYIAKGFKEGPRIRLLHGDPTVFEAARMEKKVNVEVHRLCGLIRFSEMRPVAGDMPADGGILYSPVEPDNDVLEFLGGHFSDRLKNEAFIIHDVRRGKALMHTGKDWYVTDFREDGLEGLMGRTDAEREYRRLWKSYFDAVAIKERTNPSCQRRFMPARYWKNLTEFSSI
jgi:probable DNA metabolism protein